MKRFSKALSIILSIIMMIQLPIIALAETKETSKYTNTEYTHQSKYDSKVIVDAIDVSYHNGEINWSKVKADGIDYVIIRVGYRAYGTSGSILKDTNFDTNISGAKAAGLKVGIYFYSQALNKTEAINEANSSLAWLGDNTLDLPIFYDYEFAGVSTGRLDAAWKNKTINKTIMTENALAFCNTVKNAGYDAMVYASKSFLYDNLKYTDIESAGFGVWLAHYTTKTDYKGEYEYWQYSSKGKVDGISGNVDMNFRYLPDYAVSPIENQAYTGAAITPEFQLTYKGVALTRDVDYTVEYTNNINVGTATAVVTGINTYATINKIPVKFNIVPPACTNLVATTYSASTIHLVWDANPMASSYAVEYFDGTKWVNAGVTSENSYNISSLNSLTAYTFRVSAIKSIGTNSFQSAYVEATGMTDIDKTYGLTSSSTSASSVSLKWTEQKGSTGYRVYNYNYGTAKYELIAESPSASYKVVGLTANKKYRFKVRAYVTNEAGVNTYGAYSDGYTVYTKPKATTLKSLAKNGKKKIKVSWSKVSGVTGYQIQWSTSSSFSSNKKSLYVSGASKTSKTITASKSKKKYYVRVRTYKTRNGTKYYSSWSKAKSITTK